jgi:arylsulfatase A-like enzyme
MPAILARVEGKQTYFDRNTYRTLYMSEVMNIDRLVGRLMSGLAALHLVEDSHIIFVSDHGEAFGEADVFGHGHSLHPVESRVAFFWSLPGYYRGGALIAQTVQLVDFLPTLWNLFGYTQLANLDGRDLSAVLVGEMAEDDGFAFTEAGFIGSLGRQGLKYAARTRQRAVWLDAGLPYDIEFNRLLDPWENRRHRYAPAAEDALFNSLTSLAQQAEGARLRRTKRVRLNDTQKDQLRALGYMQ